jgi:hypothetical protein
MTMPPTMIPEMSTLKTRLKTTPNAPFGTRCRQPTVP